MNYELIALWSEVIGALAFAAVIIWLFNKYLTPAVAAATKVKNEEIAAAERRRDVARAEVEAARGEVAEADASVASMRASAEVDAKRDAQRIVTDAQSEGERVIRNANGELERARLAARDTFRIELIEKALAEARVQAAARIDDNANAHLVGRFADRVGRGVGR